MSTTISLGRHTILHTEGGRNYTALRVVDYTAKKKTSDFRNLVSKPWTSSHAHRLKFKSMETRSIYRKDTDGCEGSQNHEHARINRTLDLKVVTVPRFRRGVGVSCGGVHGRTRSCAARCVRIN